MIPREFIIVINNNNNTIYMAPIKSQDIEALGDAGLSLTKQT